jgi:hypothetical protein
MRLRGKGNLTIPWRMAGQQRHLDDAVDSDQKVVNQELAPFRYGRSELSGRLGSPRDLAIVLTLPEVHGLNTKHSTMNHKPCTWNPKPPTLNPKSKP